MIKVILGEIPEEGLHVEGQTTHDIFELDPDDQDIRPGGPMSYDLHLSLPDGADMILAQGAVAAPFIARCVACLEDFPLTVELDPYAADFDIPSSGHLDLTDRLREDILLEIPGYPHCDRDCDDPGHVCSAAGRFDARRVETEDRGPSAWDALDDLK